MSEIIYLSDVYIHVPNPVGFIGHYTVNNVIDCKWQHYIIIIKIKIIVIVSSAKLKELYILACLVSHALLINLAVACQQCVNRKVNCSS